MVGKTIRLLSHPVMSGQCSESFVIRQGASLSGVKVKGERELHESNGRFEIISELLVSLIYNTSLIQFPRNKPNGE